MPQIEQLNDVLASQLFWLIVTFGLVYLVIGRSMMPKIEATVARRDERIAEDLATAERARAEADEVEESYRLRMAEVRAGAMKLTQEAKAAGAIETEKRVGKADKAIAAKVAKAEARIAGAKDKALDEIQAVAADAAQAMAATLAGAKVDAAAAKQAVREVLADG